ncbi:BMP family lipoprotein [Dactylosporangium sp. CA-233914]|uniref:BMP family lipoprotein n=1 Tax=Dactylosporangium sp. CA-233914 TaxID=3239934 RepID=UPI003D8AAB16
MQHLSTFTHRLAAVAASAALVLSLGACGASHGGDSADADKLRVGFVVDAGGINDRSFNSLGNEGMKRAQSELGVETRVLTSKSNADYVPNLTSLARQGFDLVIASGFNQIQAVETVSDQFPDTKFAILDVSVSVFAKKHPNVLGMPFKQDQASYLAGYLAAQFVQGKGGPNAALGSVGGQSIPPVESWMDGFKRGAAAVDPAIRVISGHSETFSDPAPCRQLADNQIEQGALVVFQAAGGCGVGALKAAIEKGAYAIGSDADQSNFGDHVLTSAMKKSDIAVFEVIRGLRNGEFKGGTDRLFTIADGAVGLGTISPLVPKDVRDKVDAQEKKLRDGAIAKESDGANG